MFDDCKTMSELQARKLKLYAEGTYAKADINREFNASRARLAKQSNSAFTPIEFTRLTPSAPSSANILPVDFLEGEHAGIIEFKEGVFYV